MASSSNDRRCSRRQYAEVVLTTAPGAHDCVCIAAKAVVDPRTVGRFLRRLAGKEPSKGRSTSDHRIIAAMRELGFIQGAW